MFPTHRLDTPPPASQFRRPWSPDPNDPLPSTRMRREASDVSVEALDLADYAMTLRPYAYPSSRQDLYAYPPSPPPLRPLASRDSLHPPSLVSPGATSASSHTFSTSRTPSRRPFSLPPPPLAHRAPLSDLSRSHNYPYLAQSPPPDDPPPNSEFDIAQFPPWSRGWYQSKHPPYIPYGASPPSSTQHEISPFDPGYQHPQDAFQNGPYGAFSAAPTESARDLLPWTNDPPEYGPPLDSEVKEERMRMLEREFGKDGRTTSDGDDGEPVVGSVDDRGRLVTQGPKKRVAMRAAQVLLALAAAISSIYAAIIIKPTGTPPPQGTLPAYVLYALSVLTTLALLYLFVFRPCCCSPRRRSPRGMEQGMPGGMMVLPVQGLPGGKNGKKNKNRSGKKGGRGGGDGVQVNLVVDPTMFGPAEDPEELGAEEDVYMEEGSEVPGAYGAPRRRQRRRRGVFAGLAMEEQWRAARKQLKWLVWVDAGGLVLWGAEFVLILLGKRCPSGDFEGWCDAYNIASAAACLLCVAFGVSIFFAVKDLHASRASPRTRP